MTLQPVILSKAAKGAGGIFTLDFASAEATCGVYVFGWRFGNNFHVIHVGLATNLQQRMQYHLNTVKLMQTLLGTRNGKKVLVAGHFKPHQEQRWVNCGTIIEKALSRHYNAEGHDLLNTQDSSSREHTVESLVFPSVLPETISVER